MTAFRLPARQGIVTAGDTRHQQCKRLSLRVGRQPLRPPEWSEDQVGIGHDPHKVEEREVGSRGSR